MHRLCSVGVFLTILLAGGVNSNVLNRSVNEGESFQIFANTRSGHIVETCLLTNPHNVTFRFEPRNTELSTEKYEILDNPNTDCFLSVNNVELEDEGIWTMTYDHENADSRSTNLTVNVIEPTTEPEDDEIGNSLSMIRHATSTGASIDISLDKKPFDEECYVRAPNGVLTKAEDFVMDDVVVRSSSHYVSCRITLGPMSERLLGTWNLCGQSKEDQELRCQPAEVVWNSNSNPGNRWTVNTLEKFSHPVHYGGSVFSGVSNTGTIETCSVITPNGENLVITNDVSYPNIERVASNNVRLCTINFTNIDNFSIGNWAINGKFRSSIQGLIEIHLPLRFFLYNEEQPYEQAFNVTTLPDDTYLVILGRNLEVSVNGLGEIEDCQYRTPSGQSYNLNNVIGPDGVDLKGVDATPACRLTLSPLTEDMIGEWTLIGKFSNGNQFNERRQTFNVVQEDPANPIIEDFREVEYLPELIFDSELEASHRIAISNAVWVQHESCHLLTPDGLQYAFIDGFNVPNVQILEETGMECGVRVNVTSLDMLGQYTLIARATRTVPAIAHIERRRPFTIRIEEHSSLGNAITVAEGADLYLSLPESTPLYESCKLYGPDGEEVTDFQVDQFRYRSCGYIVKNVTHDQRGTWTIVYGTQIIYRASVEVNILETVQISIDDIVWTAGSPVNMTVGPEDAVYCRLLDNNFISIFDGFGPCRIELDSVTMAHKGRWRMSVGLPGTVMLREKIFNVTVLPADNRPPVSTYVTTNGSSVILTCSVPAENEVQACLFREPTGTVLIASHGVGQDGVSGTVIRYESDSESHNCSLRLLRPSSENRGMWRCAVNTEEHTSYAFLAVTRPMIDQYSTYDSIEPELRCTSSYHGADGDAATMSCHVDAPIRYCYYRAENGTVFNVGPTISSEDYSYIGNGFDAGECGVRFNSLHHNDTGDWSCTVGIVGSQEEFTSFFGVNVYTRKWIWHGWEGSSVTLRLSLGDDPELEYCRFVRSDGLGFTSDNVPSTYYLSTGEMSYGRCTLTISSPLSADLLPWTVFAKAYGKDAEVSMTSTFTAPEQFLVEKPVFLGILLWTFFGILCLMLLLAAVSLVPKKNREWTYARASIIRDSFRKRPPPRTTIHTEMLY
ncbi:hypothetical protein PYW07_009088 [Mythimna separata]|uniref:Immunoglobulin domain-containing protein n=1 Tax=Mythimna separata TaxID=271217 RepID=A0AAD7YAZ1_MYTSE|nr:hypothetical protein PYW07_009088 [Mythimna separata]